MPISRRGGGGAPPPRRGPPAGIATPLVTAVPAVPTGPRGAAVRGAVARAEAGTSAEIRIHLDHACPGDPMARAVVVFERLGMHRTPERHGVLIYVAVTDRKLAVIGDEGIHARVGEAYWEQVV